jgi:hypothetical protein
LNRGEDEFDPLEALAAMRRRAGSCPNAATLAGFADDSLLPDEADDVRAHVSVCGICDSLVESLRNFDHPVTSSLPGWAATERRLRERVFPKPHWWRWVLHPAVAYGLLLATVIVTVTPFRRAVSPTAVAPSRIEMQSVRTIDLNTTRGAGAPHVPLGSADGFVLLSFLIDTHRGFLYEASLDGGKTQDVESSDGNGNFAVLVNRGLLSPGAHRLTVTEVDPASGKVERSLDFPFQV